jgi:hypothetical protein
MHLIQQHHTQHLADARDGLPPGQGWGMVLRGRLDNRQCNIPEPLIVVVKQGEVDRDTLLDGGITAPCRHAVSIPFVGQLLPNRRQIVLRGYPETTLGKTIYLLDS